MKRLFFIYALPNSGTSWLSVFLSMPGAFCYHEPLADFKWDEIISYMQRRPEAAVGAIDTSAYMHERRFEGAKNFVLIRDRAPLKARFPKFDADREFTKLLRVTKGMDQFYYSQFADISYLEILWIHLTGLPFDKERAEYLTEMRINRSESAVRTRLCRT